MGENENRGALTPEEMASSLEICAMPGMKCRGCAKKFGMGCAADLKREAASMIREYANGKRKDEIQ